MFSKSCKYAIRAVLYLGVNTDANNKLGVKEIAEALNIPKSFLAKILQQLSRHNLVSSSKGAGGGFYLEKENNSITLRDIIECIDGKEVFSSCILGLPVCSSENPCPLHAKALKYRKGLENTIDNQSIEAFVRKINTKKLSL